VQLANRSASQPTGQPANRPTNRPMPAGQLTGHLEIQSGVRVLPPWGGFQVLPAKL